MDLVFAAGLFCFNQPQKSCNKWLANGNHFIVPGEEAGHLLELRLWLTHHSLGLSRQALAWKVSSHPGSWLHHPIASGNGSPLPSGG